MSAWLVVAVMACIPLGSWFGVYIGRSWGSLPTMRPHAVVTFRGPKVGLEARMYVQEVSHDGHGTTVVLTSRREGVTP